MSKFTRLYQCAQTGVLGRKEMSSFPYARGGGPTTRRMTRQMQTDGFSMQELETLAFREGVEERLQNLDGRVTDLESQMNGLPVHGMAVPDPGVVMGLPLPNRAVSDIPDPLLGMSADHRQVFMQKLALVRPAFAAHIQEVMEYLELFVTDARAMGTTENSLGQFDDKIRAAVNWLRALSPQSTDNRILTSLLLLAYVRRWSMSPPTTRTLEFYGLVMNVVTRIYEDSNR